ncbi:MAG: helix-turn-helix domain-containing protein, partial [Halieaceae bacterium]|nr:helix-turn-helix domain-containing protein [Halieaceae bacterium]
MENSEAPGALQEGPGDILRRAREDAGIAPREMADQLNWLPSHVTAIEENRFGDLRSQAFVRGYLRAYARALGLDEGALIERFNALAADQQPRREEPPARAKSAGNAGTSANTTMWVVLGLLFAAMVVVMIWMRERPAETTVPTPPADGAGAGALDVEQRAAPAPAPAEASSTAETLAPPATESVDEQIDTPSSAIDALEQAPADEPVSAAVPALEEE